MTPKERAGELYFKYHNLWINGNSIMGKQCALIAVDEIINYLLDSDWALINNKAKYWEEVINEIEKL